MLRLRLDYLPVGSIQGTQLLGEICITNTGEGSMELGKYTVDFAKQDGSRHQVTIENYPRKNGAWVLVWEALTALGEYH
jgi:hypothetical protein